MRSELRMKGTERREIRPSRRLLNLDHDRAPFLTLRKTNSEPTFASFQIEGTPPRYKSTRRSKAPGPHPASDRGDQTGWKFHVPNRLVHPATQMRGSLRGYLFLSNFQGYSDAISKGLNNWYVDSIPQQCTHQFFSCIYISQKALVSPRENICSGHRHGSPETAEKKQKMTSSPNTLPITICAASR